MRPARLDIYRTSIPMRAFEHAGASRDVAEAVVVRLTMADRTVGWGETLPRPYVTGETVESVIGDLARVIWPACTATEWTDGRPAEIPTRSGDRCLNAAACAFDLACVTGALDAPAGKIDNRVSGVLGSSDPGRTARTLRAMRLFGLRDFKLKLGLGDDVDTANLDLVRRRIGKGVAAGRATLRVDVNSAWEPAEVPRRVAKLVARGVCLVEQPARVGAAELAELAAECELPLMADESLVTEADAEALLAAPDPQRIWWNIRLSKNAGLTGAMRLAAMATEAGVPYVLGCMVGESSILSAAQRRFLQQAPRPRFVEGNYGKFLLRGDLVARPLRFGYGGRLKALAPAGLGIEVSDKLLARYGHLVATVGEGLAGQ